MVVKACCDGSARPPLAYFLAVSAVPAQYAPPISYCASVLCHQMACFQVTPPPAPPVAFAGGLSKEAIKELLREHCDGAVRAFVEDKLKPRYQVRSRHLHAPPRCLEREVPG